MNWLKVRDRGAYLRLTGVLFLVFASAGTVAPLLSNYVRDLGADTGQIGVIFACYQAASLASQYFWGRWSDRIGRRKPLVVIGTAGVGLSLLATAAANWYGWMFATRALEGLAYAAYSTGALAMIGDVLEDEAQRARLMGMYRMFGSLAFALAALSGGVLADSLGLRAPLLLAAAFYGLGTLLVLGVKEDRRGARDEGRGARDAARAPDDAPPAGGVPRASVRTVTAMFFALALAWFFGMGSVVSLWPVYMAAAGHSQTVISGLWAQAALGEVVCLLLAGVLAERFGRKWVIVFGVAGMACVYTAYTISTALPFLIGVQLFRSLAYSCFETPAMLYATELGLRAQRGRMAGLYNTVIGVGGIVGSVAGGFVAQQLDMVTMFRGVAVVMVAVALVAAVKMPRQQREAEAAAAPQTA